MLSEDYLSPVLAYFLFPDLVQRFLFFPVAYFDRSTALERSLELGWDTHTAFYRQHVPAAWAETGNPFREPFSALWDPTSDVPALFLNTTEVETGRGRVIAPLTLDATEFVASPTVAPDGSTDIALSTAAVLSARFPWLTPPGWFGSSRLAATKQSGGSKPRIVHLVDGAYFDNSGLLAAVAIAREIQRSLAEMTSPPRVRITLLVLTSGGFAEPAYVVTDYLAPFQSILSTRAARASMTIKQAGGVFLETAKAAGGSEDFLGTAELRGYGYPLPLGWRLSPITRLLILGQNGDPDRCRNEDHVDVVEHSVDCLRAKIHDDMK
jgi:hypothetical protein